MTHGESESWSIRTLLLLQASNSDSVHLMRDMLCESIQSKYGTRKLKPVPLLGPNSIYMSPDEMITQKHKTENQRNQPSDENTNHSNESGTDCSDQDLEMDLSCSVCKSVVDHVWNPIVECAECHTGYHKECHEPEIMEDVSDPRVVWYCHKCNKALQSKAKSSSSSSSVSNNSKASSSVGKSSSSNNRSSSPPVSSSYGGKSSSFGGKRPAHNKLSVLSSSSGKVHNPKINIISADRRLQIMKKRAARKQDKRSTKAMNVEASMEHTFDELEASIEKTGGRLEDIATNLTKCDQFSEAIAGDTETEVVEGLLQTVKQVQTDYETFRGDLLELRELQKQIRYELQMSANELQNRLLSLRLRMQLKQAVSNTDLENANY